MGRNARGFLGGGGGAGPTKGGSASGNVSDKAAKEVIPVALQSHRPPKRLVIGRKIAYVRPKKVVYRQKVCRLNRLRTDMSSSLSQDTEIWLDELAQGLPDDLLDTMDLDEPEKPRAEQSVLADTYWKELEGVHEPDKFYDHEDMIEPEFSPGDEELVQNLTDEQMSRSRPVLKSNKKRPRRQEQSSKPPQKSAKPRKSRKPRAPRQEEISTKEAWAGRKTPRKIAAPDKFLEPRGYSAQYDDFDDFKSDEMPSQTGVWEDVEALRSTEEKRRLRLLNKAASERLRRANMKRPAQAYTELRF